MRKRISRFKHALTIEYAIVMMALVAAFVGLILITAQLTVSNATHYRTYTEQKAALDEIGDEFIRQVTEGEPVDLSEFSENDYNFTFQISDDERTLTVHRGNTSTVALIVALDEDGGLITYRYGA